MSDKKFKITLFNGEDPQAQYDAVATKDDHTLYILDIPDGGGKGYLGEHVMWEKGSLTSGSDSSNVIPVNTVGRREVELLVDDISTDQSGIKLLADPGQFDEIKIFLQMDANYNNPSYVINIIEVADFIQGRTMWFTNGSLKWDVDKESLTVSFGGSMTTHILKIVGLKYQETRVGRKAYELTPEDGIALERGVANSNIGDLTDDLYNYDTYYAEFHWDDTHIYTSPEIPSERTGVVTLIWPTLINLGIRNNQHTVYCDSNNATAAVVTVKIFGVKYETVSVEPASLSELITSIMNEELEKYVEYSVDDGTEAAAEDETATSGNNEPIWGQIIDE